MLTVADPRTTDSSFALAAGPREPAIGAPTSGRCASLPSTADGNSDWIRADIEEHVRDEHSTYAWLLEPAIERSGFWIESTEHSPDGFFANYIARAI